MLHSDNKLLRFAAFFTNRTFLFCIFGFNIFDVQSIGSSRVIFLLLTLFNSKYLTPLNKLWFKIGLILGRFISPIVMGIIFFLVVTPIAIIMKILGKDILGIKKNNKKTYWVNKTGPKSKMKNQF